MAIEQDINDTLKADTALLALLADGENSIIEGIAPENGPYSQIVFSNISEVAALAADNKENLKRITIQTNILTTDGEYNDIFVLLDADMHSLGFMFDSSTEINSTDTRIKVTRYVILEQQ